MGRAVSVGVSCRRDGPLKTGIGGWNEATKRGDGSVGDGGTTCRAKRSPAGRVGCAGLPTPRAQSASRCLRRRLLQRRPLHQHRPDRPRHRRKVRRAQHPQLTLRRRVHWRAARRRDIHHPEPQPCHRSTRVVADLPPNSIVPNVCGDDPAKIVRTRLGATVSPTARSSSVAVNTAFRPTGPRQVLRRRAPGTGVLPPIAPVVVEISTKLLALLFVPTGTPLPSYRSQLCSAVVAPIGVRPIAPSRYRLSPGSVENPAAAVAVVRRGRAGLTAVSRTVRHVPQFERHHLWNQHNGNDCGSHARRRRRVRCLESRDWHYHAR